MLKMCHNRIQGCLAKWMTDSHAEWLTNPRVDWLARWLTDGITDQQKGRQPKYRAIRFHWLTEIETKQRLWRLASRLSKEQKSQDCNTGSLKDWLKEEQTGQRLKDRLTVPENIFVLPFQRRQFQKDPCRCWWSCSEWHFWHTTKSSQHHYYVCMKYAWPWSATILIQNQQLNIKFLLNLCCKC